MTRVGVISDELWAAVESLMPSDEGRRGRRFVDHRLILEGIAWRLRTGAPWRDLPADFGAVADGLETPSPVFVRRHLSADVRCGAPTVDRRRARRGGAAAT